VLDWLNRALPSTFVARRNLTRNRVRSVLTTLGIAIGVVAVASLGIFGNTLQADVTGQLAGIGSTLVVSPAFDAGVESLSQRQVRRIERTAGNDGDPTVVPLKTEFMLVESTESSSFTRTYATGDPGAILTASSGQIPDDLRDGAIVGPTLADKLGVEPGDQVTVEGEQYRVRAVADSTRLPPGSDEAIYLPPEAIASDGFSLVMIRAEDAQAANATAMAVRSELNGRDPTVEVTELSDQVDRVTGVFETLNFFLTGVAAISLFVAGVGILNVMLMSAVERRQEVGVLRAVGLRRYDVLKIMLIEATLLGIFGSLVGGLISVGAGVVVNEFILGDPMRAFATENLAYLAFAVGFGVLIGVLSGVYPAWKASRERPVEALRH